jgi:hypothetical protein
MFRWSSHVYICGWLRNHQLVTMKVCKQYQTIASKSGIYVVYCGFVSPSTPGFIADHPQSYPVHAVLTSEAQEVSQGWWKAELCSASFRGGAEWDWRSSHERFLAVELNRYYIKRYEHIWTTYLSVCWMFQLFVHWWLFASCKKSCGWAVSTDEYFSTLVFFLVETNTQTYSSPKKAQSFLLTIETNVCL